MDWTSRDECGFAKCPITRYFAPRPVVLDCARVSVLSGLLSRASTHKVKAATESQAETGCSGSEALLGLDPLAAP